MYWKFSLRDLFLVTLAAALAAGWWTDRKQHIQKFGEQESIVRKKGARIDALILQIERMKLILDSQGLNQPGCRLGAVPNSAVATSAEVDPFAPQVRESTAD